MVTLKVEKWVRENWLVLIFAAITALVAWFLKDAVYTSSQMLESLTQAEATVISLFGIIVAYVLNSYDSRLDRLEQQIFEAQQFFDEHKVALEHRMADIDRRDFLTGRFTFVKERKSRTARGCLLVGSALVFSLLFSVIAFGVRDINNWENLKAEVSMLDITFFFLGIYGIFLLFTRITKEPEESRNISTGKLQPNQKNGLVVSKS